MIVYVGTFLVFAAILYFSYRTLGGGVADDEEVQSFIEKVVEWVRHDAESLERFRGDAALTTRDVEDARAVRKRLSGYQQQLSRLGLGDSGLPHIIETLGWACRMVESDNASDNPAVRQAVSELYDAAMTSLRDVTPAQRLPTPL